jgi:carbamoyl-phosphate synthase large subunit
MHATGGVLGIADSFELAFYKSQEAAREMLPKEGTVLISVSDPDKREALEAAREFARMGFKILATGGTRKFLSDNDIECSGILKISEGRPNIVDAIMNGDIHLVINSPIGKRGTSDDSYIRKAAIKYNVAHITTMAAAKAAAKGIAAFRRKDFQVVPLQKYHSEG